MSTYEIPNFERGDLIERGGFEATFIGFEPGCTNCSDPEGCPGRFITTPKHNKCGWKFDNTPVWTLVKRGNHISDSLPKLEILDG